MSDNAKTLIEQARSLPPQDRIALVESPASMVPIPLSIKCGRGRRGNAWRLTDAVSLQPKT